MFVCAVSLMCPEIPLSTTGLDQLYKTPVGTIVPGKAVIGVTVNN